MPVELAWEQVDEWADTANHRSGLRALQWSEVAESDTIGGLSPRSSDNLNPASHDTYSNPDPRRRWA